MTTLNLGFEFPKRLKIHNRHVRLSSFIADELESLGFTFDGECLHATLYFKSHFLRSVKLLEGAGLEWEVMGSFRTGMYVKTIGVDV